MLSKLLYQGPSFEVLYTEYAMNGKIDERAVIKASGEIDIDAPIDRVWSVLVDLPSWSRFDSNFSDVKLESTVAVGAKASFKVRGFPIQGTFAVVRPNQELTWAGKSLWTKAIDRHVVKVISSNATGLYLEESLSGVFVSLMFSSARLASQHQQWLNAIKMYIEAQ